MDSVGQEFLDRMKLTKDKMEYIKLQAVYLYEIQKMKAEHVAKIVNKTVNRIYQWAYQFRKSGIKSFVSKPRGGRQWSYMTLDEEKKLLDEMNGDATKGIVVITKVIKQKAEEKLGRPVSADYAEDLLNRHGWRKVVPRPKHPKSSKQEQEEFKKNFQILLKK